MNDLVSVIVPVFNSEKYIKGCLESILNQTYSNIEIIVVDDGSIDRTRNIIFDLKLEDTRIRYFYQENSGPSNARNNGLTKCQGDYICFVDSDDYILSTMIEKLVDKIQQNDIAFCDYYFDDDNIKTYKTLPFEEKEITVKNIKKLLIEGDSVNSLWNKIFRKDFIMDYQISFHPELKVGEDQVFIMEYISYCHNVGYVKEGLYNYKKIVNSTCRKVHSNQLVMLESQFLIRENIIESWFDFEEYRVINSIWFLQNVTSYIYLIAIADDNEKKEKIKFFLESEITNRALNLVTRLNIKIDSTNLYKFLKPCILRKNISEIIITSKIFKVFYISKKILYSKFMGGKNIV